MDNKTTFGYWVRVAPFTDFEMGKFSRPMFVGGKETPKDLNELTIGQLIDLSGLSDSNESLYTVVSTVLGMERTDIDRARAVDVVRFVGWVTGEVERINKLFGSTDGSKPTKAEKEAGIDTLRFGLFGMLDWYAVRMGIADHDQVLKTKWLRIYKCMDMDNKKRAYEIRLQKIQADEMRHNAR